MSENSNEDSIFNPEKYEENETNLMSNAGSRNTNFFLNSSHWSRTNQNSSLNVLSEPAHNKQIVLNEQFHQFISGRSDNGNLVVVANVGGRNIGKSFLIDSLFSDDQGKPVRVMVYNDKKIVNTNTVDYQNNRGDRVQFFDTKVNETKEGFLWLYFMSSLVVLNLKEYDPESQTAYLEKFKFVQKSIEDEGDLSLPKLLIVRRDCAQNDESYFRRDEDFIEKVHEIGIFDDSISSINLPYPPLHKSIKQRNIIDLPLQQFKPTYKENINSINKVIKSTPPKILKGNQISSKIFSYCLEPVTSCINSKNRINTNKIWENIIDEYCMDFSELYKKQYNEGIKEKFRENQIIKEKLAYSQLVKTKKQVEKKLKPFQNLAQEPHFQKTRAKVDKFAKDREQGVIHQNHMKLADYNHDRCEKAFSNINEKNYAAAIDSFVEDEKKLEYMKSDIMLDNFKYQLGNEMQKSGNAQDLTEISNKTIKFIFLQTQLKELEEKIKQEKDDEYKQEDRIVVLTDRIKGKQKQLSQMKQKLKKPVVEEAEKIQAQGNDLSNKADSEIDQALELLNKKRLKIDDARGELEKQLVKERTKTFIFSNFVKKGVITKPALSTTRDTNCHLM